MSGSPCAIARRSERCPPHVLAERRPSRGIAPGSPHCPHGERAPDAHLRGERGRALGVIRMTGSMLPAGLAPSLGVAPVYAMTAGASGPRLGGLARRARITFGPSAEVGRL